MKTLLSEKDTLSLLNQLPAMVYISDSKKKTIRWCNKLMEIETGYSLQEMQQLGKDFFKAIMHPEDFPFLLAARQQFSGGKNLFRGFYRMCAKDSSQWRWLFGEARPYTFTMKGDVKEVICVVHNISDEIDTPDQFKNVLKDALKEANFSLLQSLTPQEKNVLTLLRQGYKTPIIAEKLFNSPSTIRTHMHHLRVKLDAHTTASLVKIAIELGL